ncbi:hypothetical protein ALMP_07280 [Streptomyces sp. A012304]|nr:hypothetical protein ALMP_07280 [Streptomyces sp. A012304]
MQDAVRSDPGLQVGQALTARGGEDDGHLPDREDRRDQPEAEAGGSQARSGRADRRRSERFRGSPAVLRIRHASSASRPVRPRVPCVGVSSTNPVEARTAPERDAGHPDFT